MEAIVILKEADYIYDITSDWNFRQVKNMDITRTTMPNAGSPSYQLEGRTAKNLYKGPSGELADKIDKVYESFLYTINRSRD